MAKSDDKSLFDVTVKARIKALETLSRGAVRAPKGNYFKAMISATPKPPTLRVVAVKRQNHVTTIGVAMGSPGETELKTTDFTIKGVLTEANAASTGRDIAELLGDKNAAATCVRKLLELTREPEGAHKIFALGEDNRLQITDGR